MKRRRVLFIRFSQLRLFIRKVLIAVMFVSALVFMMLSKADNLVINKTTDAVSVVFSGMIQILRLPAQIVYFGYEKIRNISMVYVENKVLREENAELLILKNRFRILRMENKLLGQMLNYTPPPEAQYITAKIVAEEGDGFSHSFIAYTEDGENVRRGQVVFGAESVVGRVESVSGNYVRVLLFTDINSKIPVVIERNRERGILSGDNTSVPKLVFTSLDADVQLGDILVTSGVSGVFPAGLPVGVVSRMDKDVIEVSAMTDMERLEYVKIVDYGVYQGVFQSGNGDEMN